MSSKSLIFISYRRDDSADVTGRIYDRLVNAFGRDAIFKDVDSIPLGVNFRKYLDQQVGQCQILLAIIGRDWINITDTNGKRRLDNPADFVRIEIESAIKRNIYIIPVLVHNMKMPASSELPESLAELTERNGTTVGRDPDFHNHMDRLIKGIQSLVSQSTETESKKETIKQPETSLKSSVTEEVELKSERGIDYSKLHNLLAAEKWKEADKETNKVMLQAVGKESEAWLTTDNIDNFPCEDLRTINQLWLHYSKGKFGFSVQKEIYESLGGKISVSLGGKRKYDEEVWNKFCNRVGWKKGGEYVNYSDLTFNLNAPQAHLPVPFLASGVTVLGTLLSREDL